MFGYPPDLRSKVEQTLEELIELIEARQLPGVSELIATTDAEWRETP